MQNLGLSPSISIPHTSPLPIPFKESFGDVDLPKNNVCPSISPTDSYYDPEIGSPKQLSFLQIGPSLGFSPQKLEQSRFSFNNYPIGAQSTKNVIEIKYENDFSKLGQPIMPTSTSCLVKKLVAPKILSIHNEIVNYELPEYSIAAKNWEFNRYSDVIPKNDLIYTPTQFEGKQLQPYYLNANTIELDAAGKKLTYIATQGPKETTFNDFWKAIVVGRSHIFNLAMQVENNKLKCDDYWSSSMPFEIMDGKNKIGTVQKITEEVLKLPLITTDQPKPKRSYSYESTCIKQCIVKRTFEFKSASTGETRTIFQYHYNQWPDHGVPDAGPFKQLLDILDECSNEDGPPVIHCSAGIGRTGTLIAVHALRNLIKAQIEQKQTPSITSEDIVELILNMRRQRTGMVQSDEQLKMVYSCVHNYPGFTD